MKITIEVSIQELEAIFGKYKDIDISNPPEENWIKAEDFKGGLILKGKYRFVEDELAQRNTDKIKFDERMRGLICYVRRVIAEKIVVVSIPVQKGWMTPVESLEVEPNWIEPVK